VDRDETCFLIDCGASAMISIRRFGVNPNRIGAILLSHPHADHFGGLPSLILDAQLVSRRTQPLVIAGPKGLGARLEGLMEAHFPGSSKAGRKFPVDYRRARQRPPGYRHDAGREGEVLQNLSRMDEGHASDHDVLLSGARGSGRV
jgi:ribonuclease BN (tRNA processing enzyme)